MITVSELLSQESFNEFTLLSDYSGLNNKITGTGLFDWESVADIEANFNAGEFIITTFSDVKRDEDKLERCFRAMIRKKVAAIAVKTVYFSAVPKKFIDYANRYNIPIFSFQYEAIDNIIYTIRKLVDSYKDHSILSQKLETLLTVEGDKNLIEAFAYEINPYFFQNFISLYLLNKETISGQMLDKWQMKNEEMTCISSLIKHKEGLVLIASYQEDPDNLKKFIETILMDYGLDLGGYYCGLGSPKSSLRDLCIGIKESIYASITCRMRNETYLNFDQIGLNKMLLPLHDDHWMRKFYLEIYNSLHEYDQSNKSDLLETTLNFVKCEGSVNLTAKTMYQHSNTIRYRLRKIKKILNLEEIPDYYLQLFIFSKLHQLYEIYP